jgi:hypothetical protein
MKKSITVKKIHGDHGHVYVPMVLKVVHYPAESQQFLQYYICDCGYIDDMRSTVGAMTRLQGHGDYANELWSTYEGKLY